jgi:hypothetical protein
VGDVLVRHNRSAGALVCFGGAVGFVSPGETVVVRDVTLAPYLGGPDACWDYWVDGGDRPVAQREVESNFDVAAVATLYQL